jgi:cyclopropane-fatty-acyl-phospholipid synthase
MLFKFKSKAHSDLIMLEEGGRLILSMIKKEVENKGIIEVSDMDEALKRLEDAIKTGGVGHQAAPRENQRSAETADKPFAGKDFDDKLDPVTIKQRVIPFIEMLRVCKSKAQPIVWGV